jgi:hypothetical protein
MSMSNVDQLIKWRAFGEAMKSAANWTNEMTEQAPGVRNALSTAHGFYLPPDININGGVCGHGNLMDFAELYELPFPTTAIISDCEYLDESNVRVWKPTMTIATSAIDFEVEVAAGEDMSDFAPWCIVWQLTRYIYSGKTPVWLLQGPPILVGKDSAKRPLAIALPSQIGDFLQKREGWSDKQFWEHTCTEPLRTVLTLCAMLGLHNVKRKAMRPTPLAHARRKKHDPPLYSFHVLEVDGELWDAPLSSRPTNGYRAHARRGHIRRIASKRLVWVKATHVRGKIAGYVDKEYSLLPRGESLSNHA